MPLTRIEIEQTSHDNWHAEVEVGGMVAKRGTINAPSFDEVMIRVEDKYREFMPQAAPLRPPAASDIKKGAPMAPYRQPPVVPRTAPPTLRNPR